MRYSRVCLEALGYELGPEVVTSDDLEGRLAPLYQRLHFSRGQLAALTGIRQRRFWPAGTSMWSGALAAARKALASASVPKEDIGAVLYCGVCRDNLEPATACAVADGLGLSGEVIVQDISNACLGVLSGMIDVANRIELGQIKAGLVVSCESAREITDIMVDKLLSHMDMELFRVTLATLTGGSGAVAVLLTDSDLSLSQHRLVGGAVRAAPKYHEICRWGPDTGIPPSAPMTMETDAVAVLTHGVALGQHTWADLLRETGWEQGKVDRIVCHQVTSGHRAAILKAIGMPPGSDFSTVEYLGNMGTAALPSALAIAEEQGVLKAGDRVGLLGIGSGLNCMMLGVEW
ncbi:MAG: 3-oxoacyl-ACP synthase III [Candidatus Methylacidiphilales bacterium]|nr:3-oxoacyl-ACP synthase III [Candidatus Methylacidiphilales bacterium]